MRANPRQRRLCVTAFLAALLFARDPSLPVSAQNRPIVVAAAISLKESFSELGGIYERRTGTKVTFTFGASGELAKQIEAGAPVDVFASAAEREMDDLEAKNLIDRSTRADFARNSLVLVVPQDSKLAIRSFADLAKPGVTKIAIGNPQTVPAGQYAQQLLRNTRILPKIQSQLILAENVRQVLDYVAREEVDAGIVYATDVQVAHGRVSVAAQAPDGDYDPVLYPLAVTRDSGSAQAAKAFVALVLGPEGSQILRKYGFQPSK